MGRLNTRYRVAANGISAKTPCRIAEMNTNPNAKLFPSSISTALPTTFTYTAAPGLRRMSTASVPEKYHTACRTLAMPGRMEPSTDEIGV